MNLEEVKQYLKQVLNESPMYQNPRKDFDKFYDYVMTNPKAKKTYFLWNNQIRIPSDTILHDEEGHNLTPEQWNEFLNNLQFLSNGNKGDKKPRFSGNPMKYLLNTEHYCYGCVIEYFNTGAQPILATTFIDHPNTVKAWLEK